nr:MAG TPA: hypothetical protein [Bacteriophage sp.]DAM60734.1 MAG TPA: hypothetical protein [Bacteriophage sp.]DAN31719.1 MAG TPA: hypothetical protein [Caudoviricetes sp.]
MSACLIGGFENNIKRLIGHGVLPVFKGWI